MSREWWSMYLGEYFVLALKAKRQDVTLAGGSCGRPMTLELPSRRRRVLQTRRQSCEARQQHVERAHLPGRKQQRYRWRYLRQQRRVMLPLHRSGIREFANHSPFDLQRWPGSLPADTTRC